jgi:hypothetical protein
MVDRHPGASRDLGEEGRDLPTGGPGFLRGDEAAAPSPPALNLPYLFAKKNGVALVGEANGQARVALRQGADPRALIEARRVLGRPLAVETATAEGFAWAGGDGVVLLSPAAPSFGRYRDYRDRAAAFTGAALACGPQNASGSSST